MLKFLGKPTIVFSEFPDEIAIVINISGCPCHCDSCSEPELRQDVGQDLTDSEIIRIIKQNPGASVFGIMGGDRDHADVARIAKVVHAAGLKIGMYSGMDSQDPILLECLDIYKYGRWIPFRGPADTWKDQIGGPLCLPTSNQVYLEKHGGEWIDETRKFRRKEIRDWKRVII